MNVFDSSNAAAIHPQAITALRELAKVCRKRSLTLSAKSGLEMSVHVAGNVPDYVVKELDIDGDGAYVDGVPLIID